MNELKIFENAEFGRMRSIIKDSEILFVGKDVAELLGYSDTFGALKKHVDEEDKTTLPIQQSGSNYKTTATIINKSGLFSLILSSKLPAAKKIKHWVTSEVLPSIRKTGSYGTEIKAKEMEAKLNNSQARLNNSRSRMAALILRCATNTKSEAYKEICNKNAIDVLAGKEVMPILEVQKCTLSAEEVGKQLGISATMVGRIANKYNLKTAKYGKWFHTTCKNNSKREVDSFRYFPNAVEEIREIINNSKGGAIHA